MEREASAAAATAQRVRARFVMLRSVCNRWTRPGRGAPMVLVLLLRADMTNKPSIACTLQIIATISMGGCSRDRNSFDPEADRLLKGVSDYLASMDGFKFVAERTTEELLENDQKVHHTSLWDVQV